MKGSVLVTQAKIINFTVSCLMAILGFVLFLATDIPQLTTKIILAAFFVLIGAAKLFGYFCNDLYRLAFQFDFAIGAFFVLFAGLIFYPPVFENLDLIICFFAMISALLKVQTSFDAKKFGMSAWVGMLVSSLFVAAVAIATAFLPSIQFEGSAYLLFIVIGALDAWFTMYTVRVRVKKKNKEEHFAISKKNK